MTSLTLVSTIKSRFTSDYSQAKLFTQSYRVPGSTYNIGTQQSLHGPFTMMLILRGASKLRNVNTTVTHKIYKSSTQAPYSMRISMFSLVLLLAPSLGSVSEVRLMFSVYFLLWQLLSCVAFSCMLTVDTSQ